MPFSLLEVNAISSLLEFVGRYQGLQMPVLGHEVLDHDGIPHG